MLQTFNSLDLEPWNRLPGQLSLVTLTLPGRDDWLRYAPTGAAWARLLKRWFARLERAYPDHARFIYKTEFQVARRAPHLHLLMVAPETTTTVGRGLNRRVLDFRTFVSWSWADVVAADDRELHERAGTQVMPWHGEANRAVAYLAKYLSKVGGRKGRQDEPAEEWQQPGAGLTRVWSYRGLCKKLEERDLSQLEALWAKRLLRRWANARLVVVRVRVRRGRRWRWVTRRVKYLKGRSSWIATPEAPRIALAVQEAAVSVASLAPYPSGDAHE